MASENPRQDWAAPGDSAGSNDAEPAGADSSANQWGQPQSGNWQQTPPPPGQGGGWQAGGWQPGAGHSYADQAGYGATGPGGPNFRPMQSHKPGIIPLRALGLSEILDGAFKAIRHNPKVMFGVTLPVAMIAALMQGFLTVRLFDLLEYDYLVTYSDDMSESLAFFDDSTLMLTVLSIALNMLVIPLVTGVLTISVSRSTMGQKIPLSQIWQMLRGRKAPLLGASLLTSLAAFVPAGLLFAALPLLMSDENPALVLLMLPLGLIAIAATMFLAIRFLFVPQVVVLERQGVFTSIKRGWLLSRGSFWRILGIYLLATLIASVVSSIVSTPLSFISVALTVVSTVLAASVLAATTVVTMLVMVPYSAAVGSLLYIDVRMRREGLDIELARAAGETA